MGFFSHLLYPWGIICSRELRSSTSFGGGRIPIGFLSSCFWARWARLSIFLSRRFPTLDWWASRSKYFRAASALANSKPRFATILRLETTKNSAIFTWTTARSSRPAPRSTEPSPPAPIRPILFTGAGVCAIQLGDAAAALPDLERVVAKDPDYDFHRAAGLLAHAYAQTGQKEKAEALFRHVTITSTLSETYLNFADLLASEGRNAEAREWAQKVLDKKPTMPGYLRRRERPWFRRANEMLKRVST